MSNLVVGDARKFGAKFYNFEKTLADPTAVTLEVKNPEGDVVTYSGVELEKESTGIYSKVILLDKPGEWHVEWQGTGAIQKVASSSFYVNHQQITV